MTAALNARYDRALAAFERGERLAAPARVSDHRIDLTVLYIRLGLWTVDTVPDE
ncbi:MAG: hypothetical protein OXF79_03130 [Chloroflexi bacterium]|nr:hypothetical protein [Chloroflexota bacterium]